MTQEAMKEESMEQTVEDNAKLSALLRYPIPMLEKTPNALECINIISQEAYKEGYIEGYKICGQISEQEKTMKFAEWASQSRFFYFAHGKVWLGADNMTYLTTEELYTSQEFKDFLSEIKK